MWGFFLTMKSKAISAALGRSVLVQRVVQVRVSLLHELTPALANQRLHTHAIFRRSVKFGKSYKLETTVLVNPRILGPIASTAALMSSNISELDIVESLFVRLS
jgi:hypothetical protein